MRCKQLRSLTRVPFSIAIMTRFESTGPYRQIRGRGCSMATYRRRTMAITQFNYIHRVAAPWLADRLAGPTMSVVSSPACCPAENNTVNPERKKKKRKTSTGHEAQWEMRKIPRPYLISKRTKGGGKRNWHSTPRRGIQQLHAIRTPTHFTLWCASKRTGKEEDGASLSCWKRGEEKKTTCYNYPRSRSNLTKNSFPPIRFPYSRTIFFLTNQSLCDLLGNVRSKQLQDSKIPWHFFFWFLFCCSSAVTGQMPLIFSFNTQIFFPQK